MCSQSFDKEAKLWYGRDILPLYNPKINAAQALIGAMIKYGPQTAQIVDVDGYKISFHEILTKTIRAAQNLQALGFVPKQVFGIMGRSSRITTSIIIASLAIGCPLFPVSPIYSKTELKHMLKITTPALIFCDDAYYGKLKSSLDELQIETKIFILNGSKNDSDSVETLFRETSKESEFRPVKVDGSNDLAIIVATSGSTGIPKGVCCPHATLLNDASMQILPAISPNSIWLACTPAYGLSAITLLLSGILHGVTSIVVTGTMTPDNQLYLIEHYKVTQMLTLPQLLLLMMKSDRFHQTDLSSLQLVLVGGDKLPLHVKKSFKKYLTNGVVCSGMGMSEIGNIAIEFPPSEIDTVGTLVDEICAKVTDEDGNRCGVNIEGELCVKRNGMFLGYYGNQRATDEALDDEGFLKTGDIVYFDDDGYLHFVDRKKIIIKSTGGHIYPSSIVAFLNESPEIKSACVVGIPDPNGAGELVAGAIVRADGSNISEQQISNMVADHFSDYHKFRGGVYFIDTMPLTSTGKVSRREVRETVISLYNARCNSNEFN